ncbi:outer membrane beta-barrel protein [Mucilaginibacter agri]|uniref:Outer membrane beta-barrel protein n=1 Tax=Mucilaginibacter agri TaxID=2695265 RepID=A0A966DWH9_9SPHI|nr:outer membrane beta-barrel protein [Mucilaginibacter agri]NCD71424.1 outer membrane beta-barrel protein [Mucilaginibacter agri]
MKRLLITAAVCVATMAAFAQNADSTKTASDTTKAKKGFHISFGHSDNKPHLDANGIDTTHYYEHSKAPGFSFGLTFSRFDLGLATLIDNGSFTLSPQNNFLRYRSWKTSNVGFDLLQFGYRFNSAFKIYVSGGFDWTHIRLRENITIQKNAPVLTYTQDDIDYSKNRFSSTYLRIPLSFDYRSHEDANGRRFHLVAGPDVGLLLNGRVKQISEENGKQKVDDDYHYTKMRYGVFTRIGYGFAGLFAKYYFNDMFENSPAQDGLKNFSFGITVGF